MERHRALLRELTATEFLKEVGSLGRANLDNKMLEAARLMYGVSEWFKGPPLENDSLRQAFLLIKDVFLAEEFLKDNALPRYVHYTNINLLNRYLLSSASVPLHKKHEKARRALAIIFRDWRDFEQERLVTFDNGKLDATIIGYSHEGKTDDDVSHLRERVRTLDLLNDLCAVAGLPDRRILRDELRSFPSDWEYFASDPDRQLSHFLCLPRSRWHDEVMFLRMIHATECCFAGIIASLEVLPGIVLTDKKDKKDKRDKWLEATQALKEASFFSEFLVSHWAIFPTMPVAHFFDGFREDTGNASAIQSERFQKLDVLLRGLGNDKRAALAQQPELKKFAAWSPPSVSTLHGLVDEAVKAGGAGEEFVDVAETIDRQLLQWRTRHYGVAVKYLPAQATGTGNEGIPYLKNNYAQPRVSQRDNSQSIPDQPGENETVTFIRQTSTMALLGKERPRLAALRFGPVNSDKVKKFVESERPNVIEKIKERQRLIDTALDGYADYFGASSYPVRKQLNNFLESQRLPKSIAPGLLLSLEMKSGVLMGLHRLQKDKTLTFDVATSGETFKGISGKTVQCSANEPVIRDHKGIIGSIFQGPDKLTLVNFEDVTEFEQLFLVIFGFPGIGDEIFECALFDCKSFIEGIDAIVEEEWQE